MADTVKRSNYDIAMSGISKKLDRQKINFFSEGYFTSGKTPTSNCDDKDKYTNLNQIGQCDDRRLGQSSTPQQIITRVVPNHVRQNLCDKSEIAYLNA